MILAWIQGDEETTTSVIEYANELQYAYRFTRRHVDCAIPVRLIDHDMSVLFAADRMRGVRVATSQSSGIASYAGLHRGLFLLTASLLGMLRWRALVLNPQLISADLIHDAPTNCLFSRRLFLEEYAMLFESPRICRQCRRIYSLLCSPYEMRAVDEVVFYAARQAHRTQFPTPPQR